MTLLYVIVWQGSDEAACKSFRDTRTRQRHVDHSARVMHKTNCVRSVASRTIFIRLPKEKNRSV